MEYSAASVSFQLWFIEMKETLKLVKEKDWDEAKQAIISDNIYQQKSKERITREYCCIKRRIEALPDDIADYMLQSDTSTSKQIALVSYMMTDRMLFEIIYELYREHIRYADETLTLIQIDNLFEEKARQNDAVAAWTDATKKKLRQNYLRAMADAGIVKKESNDSRIIVKPYIEDELRNLLIKNRLEKYLYALTGER